MTYFIGPQVTHKCFLAFGYLCWMLKKLLFLLLPTAILLLILSCGFSPIYDSSLTIESKKGVSGNEYAIYYKNSSRISFEIVRPSEKDTSILICIPAAFTLLTDYTIDGLYICKGKTANKNKINHSLGGAIKIINGDISIFSSDKGNKLTDSLIASIEKQNGSLFQQIQMIENGRAAKFKDTKLFQRRGIVRFQNGKTAIVESKLAITLKIFADDLAAMQAKDLLYTDMGSWDYGWYRDPASGKIMTMGYDHSQTSKQSNWVIFKK